MADWPWYAPALVAILTCGFVGLLVGSIYLQSVKTRAVNAESEAQHVADILQARVKIHSDFFSLLADDFAEDRMDSRLFNKRSEKFLTTHKELVSLSMIEGSGRREWIFPKNLSALRAKGVLRQPIRLLLEKTMSDETTGFSKPFSSLSGHGVLAVSVPIIKDFQMFGAVIGQIMLADLLKFSLKTALFQRYQFEIQDSTKRVWARTTAEGRETGRHQIRVSLQDLEVDLAIVVRPYKPPVNLYLVILAIISLGLGLGLAWAIFALAQDNHRRRRIQAELLRAKNTAEESDRAKSRLIANISHEIRTPLGAISGYAELMKNYDETSSERAASIEAIRRNTKNLLHLVNDFLDLSKLEAGLLEIEMVSFSLPNFISECLDLFSQEIKQKGLELQVIYEESIPQDVVTDPHRLRQILLNLVSNAIKFTDSGHIRIDIGYERKKNRLNFQVKDTGIGMTKENSIRIFKAFNQGDGSISRRFGGTGLGLTISTKLAKKLNGGIKVLASEAGKGSTFSFWIDLQTEPKEFLRSLTFSETEYRNLSCQQEGKEKDRRLTGKTVLVVEDCLDNQIIFTRFIEGAGGLIKIASDGAKGVTIAMDSAPDVIVMDVQMPILDGYGATKVLRERGFRKPIIALTAHAMKGERERCILSGCDDYLTKPVDPESFIDAIEFYAKASQKETKPTEPHRSATGKATKPTDLDDLSPLYSTLRDDPRVLPVLPDFVKGLNQRILALREAIHSREHETVFTLAHRLKGTAGNYGYQEISNIALEIEQACRKDRYNINDLSSSLRKVEILKDRAILGLDKRSIS